MFGKETALPGALASVPSDAAVGRRGFIVALSNKKNGKVYDMQVGVTHRAGDGGRKVLVP